MVRHLKPFAQGHLAHKLQNWDSNPHSLTQQRRLLTTPYPLLLPHVLSAHPTGLGKGSALLVCEVWDWRWTLSVVQAGSVPPKLICAFWSWVV